MSSNPGCPTVPDLYRWDSGTKEINGTILGTRPGHGSLKTLAQAILAVPSQRSNAGQRVGQTPDECPTEKAEVGQKPESGVPAVPPDPAAITYARTLLVSCPEQRRTLHCWHCSRCSETRVCKAWRIRRADVEFFRRHEKPYSLYLVEEFSTEVFQ